MVGALNKLPVAASGILFFGDPANLGSVSAIMVGGLSGIVYAVAKNVRRCLHLEIRLTSCAESTEAWVRSPSPRFDNLKKALKLSHSRFGSTTT